MKHNTKDEILDEIKPLTIDLQEAFDNGAAFAADLIEHRYKSVSEGYLRSMITRVEV